MPPILFSARVLCPMDQPPLADGGVLIEQGTIVQVGPAPALRAHAVTEHHLEGVLLPGMVDAHTRLEHADIAGLTPPPSPAHWTLALQQATADWDADRWSRSAHRGVQAALRAGAATVGDAVINGAAVPAAGAAALHGDSWVEVQDVDWARHDDVLAGVERALDLPAHGRRIGIAPHAVWSLGTGVLQALAALARRRRVPLHVRAAMSTAERAALTYGRGKLAELARAKGLAFEWLEEGAGLAPIEYLDACGALFPGVSLVHGIDVTDTDVALMAARGVSLVLCPQAAQYLSLGDTPLEHCAEAELPLALGTDDHAAGAGADLLELGAAWVALARRRGLNRWPGPDGPRSLEEQALRLLTVDGAAAMGWGGQAGVLAPGRRGDLAGVALDTTVEQVWSDLIQRGPGRMVLTVLAGVRKARREPGSDWPAIDRQEWRA